MAPSLNGATCRRSSLTTARRVAGGGGAWCAGPRAEAERSDAGGACSSRLNNAVAEGSGARSADSRRRRSALQGQAPVPWLRGAALESQAPVAGIAT